MAALGGILRSGRREQGLRQADLAEIVGVSQSTISDWEAGRSFPVLRRLEQLAEILDVDVDTLLRLWARDKGHAAGAGNGSAA